MNLENLNIIIQNYLAQFDILNDAEHMEYVKWTAAAHFQKHWDIQASDFAGMFKKAVSGSAMLINNRTVQPTAGIVKLAERPELTETVRGLFMDLFAEDQNDLAARQNRIEHFAQEINALLLEYEPGKWKYTNDFRTALSYLNLYQPAKNYFLKSTQAHQFRHYIEYGDDFGYGAQFSLPKYYHMCDQIADIVREHPELRERHTARLTDDMCRDDNWHLTVFDLIYCTAVYGLHENLTYTIPQKTKSAAGKQKQIDEEKQRITEEIQQDKEQLLSMLETRGSYEDYSAIGMPVVHRSYGQGVIVSQGTDRLTVSFDSKQRIFMLPNAFFDGHLHMTDEEMLEKLRSIYEIDRKIERLRNAIRLKENKLQNIYRK